MKKNITIINNNQLLTDRLTDYLRLKPKYKKIMYFAAIDGDTYDYNSAPVVVYDINDTRTIMHIYNNPDFLNKDSFIIEVGAISGFVEDSHLNAENLNEFNDLLSELENTL